VRLTLAGGEERGGAVACCIVAGGGYGPDQKGEARGSDEALRSTSALKPWSRASWSSRWAWFIAGFHACCCSAEAFCVPVLDDDGETGRGLVRAQQRRVGHNCASTATALATSLAKHRGTRAKQQKCAYAIIGESLVPQPHSTRRKTQPTHAQPTHSQHTGPGGRRRGQANAITSLEPLPPPCIDFPTPSTPHHHPSCGRPSLPSLPVVTRS